MRDRGRCRTCKTRVALTRFSVPLIPNTLHPPGTIGGLQFPTTALIQLRRVALNPTPDGCVVGGQTSFSEELLHVSI